MKTLMNWPLLESFITLYLQDLRIFALAVTNSVLPADQLRLVNPDITKYLQSVKSVDDEWICQTCNSHLKKGRVPPCAIANGMQFPENLLSLILMS